MERVLAEAEDRVLLAIATRELERFEQFKATAALSPKWRYYEIGEARLPAPWTRAARVALDTVAQIAGLEKSPLLRWLMSTGPTGGGVVTERGEPIYGFARKMDHTVWLVATHPSIAELVNTVAHEVRHLAQDPSMDRRAMERDADGYARTMTPVLLKLALAAAR